MRSRPVCCWGNDVTKAETHLLSQPATLSAALLARGFLVETIGPRIYLTNNSCLYRSVNPHEPNVPSDPVFLAANLERIGLGGLSKNNDRQRPFSIDHPDQTLCEKQVATLFDHNYCGGEVSYEGGTDSCDYFRRYVHGPKVPTAALDANIALLVKAFSAVGCLTFSSCEGELASDRHVVSPLYVWFVGAMSTAWAEWLLQHARDAGIQLSALSIDTANRRIEEILSDKPGEPRNIMLARKQAIDLGCFLYGRRVHLRQVRIKWMEHYQPSETEVSAPTPTVRQVVEFRVRLSDSTGFCVEFRVDGFRALEKRCRRAFSTWLEMNPAGKRKLDWPDTTELSKTEEHRLKVQDELLVVERSLLDGTDNSLPKNETAKLLRKVHSLKEQADRLSSQLRLISTPALYIEISKLGEQQKWCSPWGDSKPVRIRIARTASGHHPDQWRFFIRRTAFSGRTATIDSWVLLWMGMREAVEQ